MEDQEQRLVGEKLAPYNPTGAEVVQTALGMLQIRPGDVIFDLGCGDARFLIEAKKQCSAVRCVGVEYDAAIVAKATAALEVAGLVDQIEVLHSNVLDVDFSDATVLFVYLVPEGIRKIKERLMNCLTKGARIVTYVFSIPDVPPQRVEVYKGSTKIYYYAIPL